MIGIAMAIFVILIILLIVYFNLRAQKARSKEDKQVEKLQLEAEKEIETEECKQVEKQPKIVKIRGCEVDLESNTCITHHCKVGLDEPCHEYSKPYLLSGSLDPYWASEWHSKYHKALEQRRLGMKEYRKQYTIPYLGGKVGIAALVCWGIMIILGLVTWISVLVPSIPDLQFPALLATFALPALILTLIVLFRKKY